MFSAGFMSSSSGGSSSLVADSALVDVSGSVEGTASDVALRSGDRLSVHSGGSVSLCYTGRVSVCWGRPVLVLQATVRAW